MSQTTQDNNAASIAFLKQLLLGFALLSLIIFAWKRSDLFPWIGGCNPAGYNDKYFMSYCHSSRFGDLEHKVFWHDLKPDLIKHVQNAEVLFLGNSRTQYAFSTTAVSDYFSQKSYKHYVFGFGMGSQNSVPEMLAQKYSLNPKALIINADPFFTNRISGTNKAMLEETRSRQWELKAKLWLESKQESVCSSNDTGVLYSLLCLGVEETLYRRIEDGHWEVRYFRKNKSIPTAIDNQQKLSVSLDEAKEIAADFIDKLGVKRDCVILTVTPRTQTPLAFAQQLATELGTVGIFPELDKLVTLDDSHLDPDSALRWSAAFLKQADSVLETCTKP